MFDFEKLDVYKVVKDLNTKTYNYLSQVNNLDNFYKDKWLQASLSVVLNLAEGVGRSTMEEKRKFITISRGKVFECTALLQSIKEVKLIGETDYQEFYNDYETASKMLLGMFRSFK